MFLLFFTIQKLPRKKIIMKREKKFLSLSISILINERAMMKKKLYCREIPNIYNTTVELKEENKT
jgi:hypothetical protein